MSHAIRLKRVALAALASQLFLAGQLFGAEGSTVKSDARTAPADPAIERGEYLARAADCMSCHTAKGGQPFAGGNALQSAFGALYGPNITPDVATGIGAWTEQDFDRALRLGIRRDGAYLYPAMPYDSYTKLSADDMHALWSYFRSLHKVRNTVPKDTLPFPLTIRSGLALWQDVYFKPGPFQAVPDKGPQWNRGAYLVQALGHCADCHTPRNLAQGLETKHQLTGAQVEGWYAADISDDAYSKLNGWSSQQLASFLKTGRGPGNVRATGPMLEVVQESLSHLTNADLQAMAVYLLDQPGAVSAQQASVGDQSADLARGKQIYEEQCGTCHQSDGKGINAGVPALAGSNAVTAREPYNVIMAILQGFPAQGNWGAMGSFANALSDEEIADVTDYVRTAWGNQATPNATSRSVEHWRQYATVPTQQPRALLCPVLPKALLQPVLDGGDHRVMQAAGNRSDLQQLVDDYKKAVPQASKAQTVEALSDAYCRALANEPISEALMEVQIADFAQQVAQAMVEPRTHG